jgi:CRISPR system Cascade subunit CasE
MHLTRLILDPRSAQARRDLADAYDMHRTLSRAFVTGDAEQPSRFLWRLERDTNPWTHPTVLVQSRYAGEWGVLQSLPGYLQKPVESKVVELDRCVQVGGYRFRLMANPAVTRLGKRYGLMAEEVQLEWLKRQGVRHGFAVKAAVVSASDLLESKRKPGGNITVQQVCFDGLLEVLEPSNVRKALQDGIGPAKAFGCGLLSLARA